MKILAFDPSGNFEEGQGTTGYAIGDDMSRPILGDIKSENYDCRQAYWFAHAQLIIGKDPDIIVIESFKLFGHKAKQQIGSSMETPQLIGYIEMVAWKCNIPVVYQDPSTKQRHTDDILVKMNILEKKGGKHYFNGVMTNLHQRDALRHYLFFKKYGIKKIEGSK